MARTATVTATSEPGRSVRTAFARFCTSAVSRSCRSSSRCPARETDPTPSRLRPLNGWLHSSLVMKILDQVKDVVTGATVFGAPYEKDGVTVIPAAKVSGGGGGGQDSGGGGGGRGGGGGGPGGRRCGVGGERGVGNGGRRRT